VLEYAFRGLDDKARKVLQTIAAFRMPASYDTLAALFVGEGKLFSTELGLDTALKELEDRGLLGWDKRANRYDLHPIVRGVVWSGLPNDTRSGVFTSLQAHFDSVPKIYAGDVTSLEDLTPAIELYNTLIGLGRYDDALDLFDAHLDEPMLYRLSANRQRAELLEMLFPDGLDQLPHLNEPDAQGYALNSLALAYQYRGEPKHSVPLFHLYVSIAQRTDAQREIVVGLCNLSDAQLLLGAIHDSEYAARRALETVRKQSPSSEEGLCLDSFGLTLVTRGVLSESKLAFQRALQVSTLKNDQQEQGIDVARLSQQALWQNRCSVALQLAKRAWKLAQVKLNERDFIVSARLQGIAAAGLNDFDQADERLHYALTRARAVNLAEEEIPALVALAELRRRQGNPQDARELLDDVWELAERGPYPLFHADAFNLLAQIERDADNHAAAVDAATKAYRLAWCDGEPYAYHWGLVAARKHLRELGAPEPQMPPFDESKYEPMPEVEINPKDEFFVEPTEDA
jgi:tetratricopeptide (TPR) repeat protein